MSKTNKQVVVLTPAQKAWQTRKANAAKQTPAQQRAAKAWKTRRANAAAKQ